VKVELLVSEGQLKVIELTCNVQVYKTTRDCVLKLRRYLV